MRSSKGVTALVGPMGAGKSTVGKCLAKLLNKSFLDTDHEIESSCGAGIPWIFDVEGEDGFRNRETSMLEKLSNVSDLILSTGGGIVLRERNRQILRSMDLVIYLTAPVEVLFQRVAKDTNRPLLQVEDPLSAYREIFEQRDPLYNDVADLTFVSDYNSSPRKVAQLLTKKISEL